MKYIIEALCILYVGKLVKDYRKEKREREAMWKEIESVFS